MTKKTQIHLTIPPELGGMRLDLALTTLLPDYSRTKIQDWLKKSEILVNGKHLKARDTVIGGEEVVIAATPIEQPAWEAEDIPLDIIYEDNDLLVINKPIGMVVHPGAGNTTNTLLNALLHHAPTLKNLPRAGIIHRIDKDTTGLLVIAKTEIAFKRLTIQMKHRDISRIYQAIVLGNLIGGGTIDEPIDRHPIQRKRMAVVETGKPAITHFRIMEKYTHHTRLKIQLETGRTHQIRVHMAFIKHPILGDQTYGGRLQLPKGASSELIDILRRFKRQALHAFELSLTHPTTQKVMTWEAPLPDDMQELIAILKQDTKTHEKK